MGKYILRRFLISVPLMFAITLVTFVFINLAPGDPLTAMMNPEMRAGNIGDLEAMREAVGLDKPIPVRYFLWLKEILKGNFGTSFHSGQPVLNIIGGRILPTLELTAAAFILSTVFGTLFGVIAAMRQYSLYDYLLGFASLFGLSIPGFFLAMVALLIFSDYLPFFPTFGMQKDTSGFNLTENLHHLILPAAVLSIESMAANTRYARTAMLDVLTSDYITTARAKGLSQLLVVGRHAFRNALLPLVTLTSLRLPGLIGGAIIIEFMFAWPGMGILSIRMVEERDYTVLMGLTFFIALMVLAANLLADILYAYVDPRIRVTE